MNGDSRPEDDSRQILEIVESAIQMLNHEERILHDAALIAGCVDKVCGLCPKAFLAHEHNKECGRAECPWKMGEIERMQKYGDLTVKRADKDQLQLGLKAG
jgi:hypothetical protein